MGSYYGEGERKKDYRAIYANPESRRYYTFSYFEHFKDQKNSFEEDFVGLLNMAIAEQERREEMLVKSHGFSSVEDFEDKYLDNAYDLDVYSDIFLDRIFNSVLSEKEGWVPRQDISVDKVNTVLKTIEKSMMDLVNNYYNSMKMLSETNTGEINKYILDQFNKIRDEYGIDDKGSNNYTGVKKTKLKKQLDQIMRANGLGISLRGFVMGEIGAILTSQRILPPDTETKTYSVRWAQQEGKTKTKADLKLGDINLQSKNYSIRGADFNFHIHSTSSIEALGEYLDQYDSNFDLDAFIFNFVNIYQFEESGDRYGTKIDRDQIPEWTRVLNAIKNSVFVWLGSTTGLSKKTTKLFKESGYLDFTNVDFYVVGQGYMVPVSTILKYARDNAQRAVDIKITKKYKNEDPDAFYKAKRSALGKLKKDTIKYPKGVRAVGSAEGRKIAGSGGANLEIMLKFPLDKLKVSNKRRK